MQSGAKFLRLKPFRCVCGRCSVDCVRGSIRHRTGATVIQRYLVLNADESTPALSAHAWNGRTSYSHGGEEIGRPCFFIVRIRQFERIALRTGDAGGMDHDVDLPESLPA